MKRLNLLLIIALSSVFSFGQTTQFKWAKQIGGTGNDYSSSIVNDQSGNIYITGNFDGDIDFDPGVGVVTLSEWAKGDIFVAKFDTLGNLIWAKNLGGGMGTTVNESQSIAVDDFGNAYITGCFYGTGDFDPNSGVSNLTSLGNKDVFVVKLNSSGNFVWAKQIGGVFDDMGMSIDVDQLGCQYITGYIDEYYSGMIKYNDIFVSKLDALGNLLWTKRIEGNSAGCGFSISEANGYVYITGDFRGVFDFNPNVGVFNLTATGLFDFILKLDSSGNFIWAKALGGNISARGVSVCVDISGNIYSTGFFSDTSDFDPDAGIVNLISNGATDMFILKLDGSGNFLFAKQIGGTASDYSQSITLDKCGNIYTTGFFFGTVDFNPDTSITNLTSSSGPDIFILKLDAFGNFLWAKNMGGTDGGQGLAIAVDDNDNVYSVGKFVGTMDFDPDAGTFDLIGGSFYSDAFIQKISQTPICILGVVEDAVVNSGLISLFPNPTTNNLTIATTKPTNISIVNLLGQELFNSKIEKSETIDVSFLSKGIYFVKDLQNGGSVKFVKQ